MTVSAKDFPAGTENRLSMRVGCYVLYALATIALLIRLYIRTFMSRKLGLDDFFVIIAWISETVVIAAVKLMFERGIGWHAADIMTLKDGAAILTRMVFWPWVAQFLYFFGLGCIKASIVALYLRLAVNERHRKILWVALIICFAQGLASGITVAGFLCNPLNTIWTGRNGGFGGPACINILAFNYYNAAIFILGDILLALAPMAVLKDLQMDSKRKASLAVMFGIGLLAIGGTISRQVTNAIAINKTSDFTWYWAPAELCSVLESSLGIIFVSVPAMAPLFTGYFRSLDTSAKYTPGFESDRPSTFGKLGGRPKLRLDDDDILYETRITAVDSDAANHQDYDLERERERERNCKMGSYEMNVHETRDSGSETRIIPPSAKSRCPCAGNKKRLTADNVRVENLGEVRVDVDYDVSHEDRAVR